MYVLCSHAMHACMRASPKARRRCTTPKPWKRNRFGLLFCSLDSEIEFGIEYHTAFHGPWRRNMMPSAAARWRGALGKVPPAPAKHDAGRASPIAQIVVWPSPGSSAASAFRGFVCSQLAFAVVFWLTSFLQIFCLLLFRSLSSNNHVRSRRRRRRHRQGQPGKF